MNILSAENLKVYFHQQKRTVKALDGVDIFLKEGQTTSLAGESGCGKTTLARSILGFCKPKEGKIYFKDKDITLKVNGSLIRENIQIVFQNPFSSLDPRYSVYSTLHEALLIFKKISSPKAGEIIQDALCEVELDKDILRRYPHQLSGGQCQRVCIARALINKPSLVILDEPTSSLDVTTASKIISLLKNLQEHLKITFLFISHDLGLLENVAQFCFIMYEGRIVEYGPKDLIYSNPLHPYTKLLLKAAKHELKYLEDELRIPCGCPLEVRCAFKKAQCAQMPQRREIEDGHFVFCHQFDQHTGSHESRI